MTSQENSLFNRHITTLLAGKFVLIMPNHVHVILYFPEAGFDLNKIIGNAKRFMAYEIINRLEALKRQDTLNYLAEGVTERERKKGQLHKVFTD